MGTIQKKLGEKIRILRKQKDLSQQQLAELTRMDLTSINEVENGRRNPSLRTINKIARALGASPKDLL